MSLANRLGFSQTPLFLVDGSAYIVGGASMNYARSGNIVVAPMRVGVGMRLGANLGFIHFTPKASWNPF